MIGLRRARLKQTSKLLDCALALTAIFVSDQTPTLYWIADYAERTIKPAKRSQIVDRVGAPTESG